MLHAVVSAIALGVISTLGDYIWAVMHLRHQMTSGLVHGAVICLCIGAAIGIREGRLGRAVAFGPLIGVLAAGLFYLLAPWLRYGAMFPAWMFFWICFAVLQSNLRGDRQISLAVARGVAAAILSGAAFYAISGIWTRPSPGGPDYVRNLWSWTVAFLPDRGQVLNPGKILDLTLWPVRDRIEGAPPIRAQLSGEWPVTSDTAR